MNKNITSLAEWIKRNFYSNIVNIRFNEEVQQVAINIESVSYSLAYSCPEDTLLNFQSARCSLFAFYSLAASYDVLVRFLEINNRN